MKILHYIYDHIRNPWVGGGGAIRAMELGRRLVRRGHEVMLISGRYPGAADHESEGVEQRFVGSDADNYVLSTFCYAARAIGHLRRNAREADIVVEDFAPYSPILARWLSGKTPAVIQTHHREGRELFGRYNVMGLPFMLCEATYPRQYRWAIVVSEESKKKFNIPRAEVISNGIDSSLLDVPHSDGGYICFMGRLHEHNKGLDTLLEAMKLLEGVRLVIAGRGRDEDKLKEKARLLGIANRVEFRGYVNETQKRDLVSGAELFILPSRYEGQGIVVIEAAAMGTPVVVSSIEELGYAVDEGFARRFQVGDAGVLANAVLELLGDSEARDEMSRRGRQYALEHTWDALTDKYEQFLLSVSGKAAQ